MEKTSSTIRVRWTRSAIGFTRRQKQMVNSLGLRRLRQVVELADNPSVRGLVARIPRLVEIVSATPQPVWLSIPEYSIRPPEPVLKPTVTEEPGRSSVAASSDEPVAPPAKVETSESAPESSGSAESASPSTS